jgi:Pyruvate/2-oxoacid:ferredoxin oxidoreductase delta subunit
VRPAALEPPVAVSRSVCTGCGACLLTCPEHALRPVGGTLVVTDACSGCLECIEVCPADAITEAPFPMRAPGPVGGRVQA